MVGIHVSDESNRNPFTGANYVNLDGTPNYQQTKSFASTLATVAPMAKTSIVLKSGGTGGLGYISEKAVANSPHFGPILKGVYVNSFSAPILNFTFGQWNSRVSMGNGFIQGAKLGKNINE